MADWRYSLRTFHFTGVWHYQNTLANTRNITLQTYSRYITCVIDLFADGEEVAAEVLIPKYQLQDLCAEAAKLKTLGAMESIPTARLVKLLNILEMNVRDGARVSPIGDPVSLL